MKLTDEQIEKILVVGNYFHNRNLPSDLREILTLRKRVQELEGLIQAVDDAWHCGNNDDLQRACGAIVDYTKEKGHE